MNPLDRGHELAVSVRLRATAHEKDKKKDADRRTQVPQNAVADCAALVSEIAHYVLSASVPEWSR